MYRFLHTSLCMHRLPYALGAPSAPVAVRHEGLQAAPQCAAGVG